MVSQPGETIYTLLQAHNPVHSVSCEQMLKARNPLASAALSH